MKCRVPLTAREKRASKYAAEKIIAEQLADVSKRTQYIWMLAMLDAGLSAKTVQKVYKSIPTVVDLYQERKQDGVADYSLVYKLKERGILVEEVSEENEM